MKRIWIALSVFVHLAIGTAAFAAPRATYAVVPLPGATRATAISGNGRWVASSEGVVWNDFGKVLNMSLDTVINRINNDGLITGVSRKDWTYFYAIPRNIRTKRSVNISWQHTAVKNALIADVNNAGLMVGRTDDWIWSPMTLVPGGEPILFTGFTELPNHFSITHVNDAGDMLWCYAPGYSRMVETYIVTATGEKISLGSDVYPREMSSKCHVIGACTRDNTYVNFRWDPRHGMISLKSYGYGAELNGVNSRGAVVGTAYREGVGEVGVIWTNPEFNPTATDLNNLIGNSLFRIVAAHGISENGTIAVSLVNKGTGDKAAGILKPRHILTKVPLDTPIIGW